MKAVVLVGGEGTRLRPLTYDTPKPMLPVAGVTMIERVLGHLSAHGVTEAVLSLGYHPDCFVAAFPSGEACGVKLSYAVDPHPLGTAGAIRFAGLRGSVSESFLVVNGDVLTDADYSDLARAHSAFGGLATIALTPVEDPSAYGVVPTDARGRVIAFIEKPPPGQAPTNLVNAGAYMLEPEVLERIPEGRAVSVERETFPALAEEASLFAWPSDAYWVDTGTPETYLRANLDLLSGVRPGCRPAPGAQRTAGGAWATGEAVVNGTADQASLLLPGCVIEEGAEVYRSVVGAGARVGVAAHLTGSLLMDGAELGAGAKVEDSILGVGARVGEAATLSDFSVLGNGSVLPAGQGAAGARVMRGELR